LETAPIEKVVLEIIPIEKVILETAPSEKKWYWKLYQLKK